MTWPSCCSMPGRARGCAGDPIGAGSSPAPVVGIAVTETSDVPVTEGLRGRTVLVPRGGPWGQGVARAVRQRGGEPWVVPLIETREVTSAQARLCLDHALGALAAGEYGWLAVTSAATADVLAARGVPASLSAAVGRVVGALANPASGVRVAAVGPATAQALTRIGLAPELVPAHDFSAAGLVACWPDLARPPGPRAARVLVLTSDLARTTLADGLRAKGWAVDGAVAYETVDVAVDRAELGDLAAGRADVVLVTSGSVARRVAGLTLNPTTQIACLGPVTACDAETYGLRVDHVAARSTVTSLLDSLEETA